MRLLLVGLDNPQSSEPQYALYPRPPNCTGHRLLKMIQLVDPEFTERHYLRIPRTNLFPVGMCPKAYQLDAKTSAGRVLLMQLDPQDVHVVLLGKEVKLAVLGDINLKMMHFYSMSETAAFTWLPHPSGRNREYNDKKAQRKVGAFLRSLVKERMGF